MTTSSPTRRKAFPNDVFTWLALSGTFFLLLGLGISFYYLDIHFGFLGLFAV